MHNEYKHYALDLCPRKARYWSCRQIGTEERRAQKESGQEHEMDVNEFGQVGKQKGDMQCRLSVLRTQSRFEHGKQLPTLPPATRNWTSSTLVGFGVVVRRAAG